MSWKLQRALNLYHVQDTDAHFFLKEFPPPPYLITPKGFATLFPAVAMAVPPCSIDFINNIHSSASSSSTVSDNAWHCILRKRKKRTQAIFRDGGWDFTSPDDSFWCRLPTEVTHASSESMSAKHEELRMMISGCAKTKSLHRFSPLWISESSLRTLQLSKIPGAPLCFQFTDTDTPMMMK